MKARRSGRKFVYIVELVLLVSLVAGTLGLANYVFYRHRTRFDLTPGKTYTLAPLTLKLLDGLTDDLNVTIFHKRGEKQEFQDLLDLFTRRTGRLAYQFIDLDKNPARAASFDISHYGVAIIEYQGKREKVQYLTEDNLVGALIRLTEKNTKIVRFVTGHGEKDLAGEEAISSYSQIKNALEVENYQVRPLLLMNAQQVPADTLVLVIAGPQEDYFPRELDMLKAYLQGGGRVLMLCDSFPLPHIEQFLQEHCAIELARDYIIDTKSKLLGYDTLTPLITPDKRHPIARFMNKMVVFPYCRSVLPKAPPGGEIAQTVLAVSGPDSWAERNTQSVRDGVVSFDAAEDLPGPIPVAVIAELPPAADNQVPGRLVVMGNSNFAANHYLNVVGNRDLFLNSVNWLAEKHDLLSSRGVSAAAPELYFMTKNQGRIIYWLSVVIEPGLVLLFGIIVIWWRRRRA